MRPIITRNLSVAMMAALLLLLLGFSLGIGYAYPVPELPGDNLIVNPWFRSASDLTKPGFDGWIRLETDGITWGPSQKESNPSPDVVISGVCGFEPVYCGTAARWAEQSGVLYPNIDVYAYQIVKADPSQRRLRFFTYYVSHRVEVGAVTIYGSDSPDGPWELVWVPLFHTQDEVIVPESGEVRDLWEETGFLEWDFEHGYPYYKVELRSRLPESNSGIRGVGFKITGIYFSTAFTSEPGAPAPTPSNTKTTPATNDRNGDAERTPMATATKVVALATATPPNAPVEATSIAAADADAEIGVTSLTAEAISDTEIGLTWSGTQNSGRGFRLERSSNGTTGWQYVGTVGPEATEYVDSGLRSDTVYYYRLRASQEASSDVVSITTLAQPGVTLEAPAALQAVSELPLQVELTWSDRSDNEAGFVVERSQDGENFSAIDSVGRNVTSFVDTDLVAGDHYYRVRSYRNDTYSDYSQVAIVKVSDSSSDTRDEMTVGDEPEISGAPEGTGQADDSTLPGQGYLLVLAAAFVAVLVAVGLLVTRVRRRS